MNLISKLSKASPHHRAASITKTVKCTTPPLDQRTWPVEYNIVLTEILSENSHSTVYGAHFESKSGGVWNENGTRVDAVLKMGNLKAMTREAFCYADMKELQGSVLPHMFGFLKAYDGTAEGMGCLVLERFGKALEIPLNMLEKGEKYVSSRPSLLTYLT